VLSSSSMVLRGSCLVGGRSFRFPLGTTARGGGRGAMLLALLFSCPSSGASIWVAP
jgi:hypothetical protein